MYFLFACIFINTLMLTWGAPVEHGVFLLKGLGKIIDTPEKLIKFGEIFGEVDGEISGTPPYLKQKVVHSPGFREGDEHCMFNVEPTEYYTRIIKEPGEDLSFGEGWHADLTYLKTPPTYSIIRAIELPHGTSRTKFKDMRMVLEDYPYRDRLTNLMANHSDNFNTSTLHPVVKNGILNVNQAFTRNIAGDDDYGNLLQDLLRFIDEHTESEFTVEWSGDDILMWDNRYVFHSAVSDYPTAMRREIQRVVVCI